MPNEPQFAKCSPVLLGMVSILRDQGILTADAPTTALDEPVRLAALQLEDDTAFAEFGFGIFLAWLHHHKFGKDRGKPGSYHLLYLTDQATLFLCRLRRMHTVIRFREKTYVDRGSVLQPFPTGDRDCQACPLRWALKYNHSSLMPREGLDAVDPCELSAHAEGGCEDCKEATREELVKRILHCDRNCVSLGGDGCVLAAPPPLFDFAFTSPESTPEELFNSYLVLHLGLKNQFTLGVACAELSQPVRCDELDAVVFDEDGGRLMAVETTRSYRLNAHHLRRKIKIASSLPKTAQSTRLAYLTLGDRSTIAQREDRKVQSLRARGLFDLICMPDNLRIVRELERFERAPFHQLFEHYLQQLERLVPSKARPGANPVT